MAERFEANTFVGSQGDSLLYRLMKPLDYDSVFMAALRSGQIAKQVAATLPAQLLSTPENRKRWTRGYVVTISIALPFYSEINECGLP